MRLRVPPSFAIACLVILAVRVPAGAQQPTPAIAALAQSRDADSLRLRRLIALHWDYTMREYPEFATAVGYPGQNARWTDNSADALARRKRELNEPLAVLRSIDRARLPAADQLNYDLFRRNITDAIEEGRFPGELMPVTQLGGVQQDVPSTIAQSPANTVGDYEDIVARLRGVPALVDQTIALLERGLAARVTPPRVTLRDVPQQVQNLLVDDPLTSPLLQAFRRFPPPPPCPPPSWSACAPPRSWRTGRRWRRRSGDSTPFSRSGTCRGAARRSRCATCRMGWRGTACEPGRPRRPI